MQGSLLIERGGEKLNHLLPIPLILRLYVLFTVIVDDGDHIFQTGRGSLVKLHWIVGVFDLDDTIEQMLMTEIVNG